MKNLFSMMAMICLSFLAVNVNGQNNGPAASPASKSINTVGTTEITIEYSRPGVKDRDIYGGLVPYGKVWRTGANGATKISFNKDIMIEGKSLAAGDYALNTTPGKDSWGIHFHKYTEGSPNAYIGDDKTPVLSVNVKPEMMGDVGVESFMITLDNLRNESGTLYILWANTVVPVELGVK